METVLAGASNLWPSAAETDVTRLTDQESAFTAWLRRLTVNRVLMHFHKARARLRQLLGAPRKERPTGAGF